MAGRILKDLPPETPFLQSDGQNLVNRTPIMRRFNVAPNAAAGAAANGGQQPARRMQVMGMTFNRPDFAGATANQT